MVDFYKPDKTRAQTARVTAEINLTLARYLGIPATPGMVLLECVYTEEPWVPVAFVARRACVSEDTARRRLEELVAAGRARKRPAEVGKGSWYRMEEGWADRITDYILKMGRSWLDGCPDLQEQLENIPP